jgi:hypothetical protein
VWRDGYWYDLLPFVLHVNRKTISQIKIGKENGVNNPTLFGDVSCAWTRVGTSTGMPLEFTHFEEIYNLEEVGAAKRKKEAWFGRIRPMKM